MLIRLGSHHKKNSNLFDKVIDIKGLPDSMFFKEESGKLYIDEYDDEGHLKFIHQKGTTLKQPWTADIPENFPKDVLQKFSINKKIFYLDVFKAEGRGVERILVPLPPLVGVQLDYQTAPGQDLWDQIERILERETPRDKKVPEPIVVGDRSGWKIGVDDIPSVVLVSTEPLPVVPKELIIPTIGKTQYHCDQCEKIYDNAQAIRMHKMKKHPAESKLIKV